MGHGGVTIVHRGIVLMEEEAEPNLSSTVGSKGFLNGDEILKGFGHLKTLDMKVTSMKEVVDPLLAVQLGLRLGNLILMMREPKVYTT